MKQFLVALILLGGVGTAVVLIINADPSRGYTATCRFKRQSDTTMSPVDEGHTEMVLASYQQFRSLLQYNLKGDPALRQLIQEIDELHRDLPATDDNVLTVAGQIRQKERIEHLRAAIVVTEEIATDSMDMVRVEVTLKDGHLAAQIANKLVEQYLKKVRAELDDSLIQQKKFFTTEATRYRRKLAELETQRLRFANNHDLGELNLNDAMSDPSIVQRLMTSRPQEIRDRRQGLNSKIKYLTEMFADRPIGDVAAIQIVEWKVEIDRLNTELEKLKLNQEKLEILNRHFFGVRNEWLKIQRDTEAATRQLKFWDDKLNNIQRALTMAVSERGMRLNIIEHAVGPPGQ